MAILALPWLLIANTVQSQSPGEPIIIIIIDVICYTVYTVFLVHPTSIAAVSGSTVEFTCTANSSEDIRYRINGSSAGSQQIAKIGFEEHKFETVGDMTLRSNLSVTVSSLYNNTEILCKAIGDPNVNSNTATLTVQGGTHACS